MIHTKTNVSKFHQLLLIVGIVISILIAIASLTDKGYLSSILFLLLAFFLFTKANQKLVSLFSFLNSKPKNWIAGIVLCFVGFITLPTGKSNGTGIKELSRRNVDESIKDYLKINSTNSIFKNIDTLIAIHGLYNEGYFKAWDFQGEVLSINNEKREVKYEPFKIDTLCSKLYSKEIDNKGYLLNYYLVFKFDKSNKVENVEAVAVTEKDTLIWKNGNSVEPYLIAKEIDEQKQLKSLQTKLDEQSQAKKALSEKFKEDCISPWDGSCKVLVDYVKNSMNDPESFEHVETGFWNMNTHAVVLMKFRGKNAFGGKVLNAIKAEISWDCKVINVLSN
jgi:hypothetical protein